MNYFDVDTDKIKDYGNNVKILTDNLITQLNGVFAKLSSIESTCWVGLSAHRYVESVKIDEIKVMNFVSKLKEESDVALKIAKDIDSNFKTIKENYRL